VAHVTSRLNPVESKAFKVCREIGFVVSIVISGQCNARRPKVDPLFCNGQCCHYLGPTGYGPQINTVLQYIAQNLHVAHYTKQQFAEDYAYNGVFKTLMSYWDASKTNPSGRKGGCCFQNDDGSCQLHVKDEQEGSTSNPDYYVTDEPVYNKPNACRRFPLDIVSEAALLLNLKLQLTAVGQTYPLNGIWPKCGYVLEVVEG